MTAPPTSLDRQSLRLDMRRRRQALSEGERNQAAHRLGEHLVGLPEFRQARLIAAYLGVRGEIDLAPTIDAAWNDGKTVCIPLIEGESMRFFEYARDTRLRPGPFGIRQPDPDTEVAVDATALDLVLVPLVAFDPAGNRLGMGGGYYDRQFAFRRATPDGRPRLAGVAHAFQQVPALPAAAWDVPLDLVATDQTVIRPGA